MKPILLVLSFLLAVTPLQAKKVKGSVKSEGKPLAGVIVTDGYGFTRTSSNGNFSLNTHRDARFVYVVTPSGYVAPFESGAPQFYLPLKGTRSFHFELLPFSDSKDYTLFSVSDPQMQNDKHLKRFLGRPLGDLRGMARRHRADRQTVGVALGDIAWNKLEMFDDYKAAIARTGIPFYAVIGNHDFIQNRSGIAAGEAFEAAFGPYNHAFFLGDDLVICVNNILFEASGSDDPSKSSNKYKEGYSEESLNFVKGLLAFIPRGSHVYMAQHSPIRVEWENAGGDIVNADKMMAITEGYKVDILSGHTHLMGTRQISESITDYNAAAIGGAWWATDWCRDGTPRGYHVITSIGGEVSINWHNIDYPDDFQVRFIGMDKAPKHRNAIVANVWQAAPGWKVEWTQDGTAMGEATPVFEASPDYAAEILDVYKGDFDKIPGYKRPVAQSHYFAAEPSQYARHATMTVTAPDGRTWTHSFDLKDYVDIQAHRGGAGLMPENTLSAMKHALDLNVNTLEMDLQLSADGKVVVSHDNYFHPRYSIRPDGSPVQKDEPREYLYTMPYDSIARYEVGLRPVDRWPTQKKVSERKPLLTELLDFTERYSAEQGLSAPRYNIEIKSRPGKGEGSLWPDYREFCDKALAVLLAKNLGDRLVIQSFDPRALEYIHAKHPEVELSFLTEDLDEIASILDTLSFKPRWWSPNHEVVTPENVAYCHALGIQVVPWTVDDPEDIKRMVNCGADAIISNYPDILIETVRRP